MNRPQRIIVGVVVSGVVVIAGIGFAGSYAAVRDLAVRKGFGTFAHVFPIGVDAGIVVLLALDLLVTWLRMPFPLLRHTAWLLTGATIAFNGAVAWPDPLGVSMHGVIPLLFVVAVEAARNTVGQLASITAGRHMEPVRLIRWLLSPVPTFKLWRRMKLWELRSYDQVIKLEQERLVYKARLRTRFGWAWRRKAPVEAKLPLRLVRYGVPLSAGREHAAPAGPEAPAGTALESHVAEALAITSTDAETLLDLPAGAGMNVPSAPVNSGAAPGVNAGGEDKPGPAPETVNGSVEREPAIVNPGVNPLVHALAADPVNGSWKSGSRSSVNGPAEAAGSRLLAFTPTVNGAGVNGVNGVNPLATASVNRFTPIVKSREFTREDRAVNPVSWSVNRPVALRVNGSTGREPGGVNGPSGTVNPVPDASVNEHPDEREEDTVNHGEKGVNGSAVNSRRSRRAHSAREKKPRSVHAAVGGPNKFKAERAKAAAKWFAAKEANPALTQKAFAQDLGKSEGWLSKALDEAREAAAADDGTPAAQEASDD
ncbi:DUF2637 domain-containing protein [Streptomyces sp. NPDC001795]|uniref:DUF2637 domain-containing protein n=1 Tax=Streptomyces sp. NPDC001795 TaxID=3154525 RepID=UPI00332A07AF